MNRVVFWSAALRRHERLPASARRLLKNAIEEQLALKDATEETRNRFRLRRLSQHADYELRIEPCTSFTADRTKRRKCFVDRRKGI